MPARRALLIACDEFQDSSFENLVFPRTDAERLSAALANEKLCFFDEAQVLQNPSLEDVRRSVYRMARAAERDDLILLYYTGHGALDADGSLALILPNTESDLLGATSLVADDIKRAFNQSRAAQKVLIFDCCYAGAVGSAKMKGNADNSLQSLAQETSGTYILTASTRFQPAYEQNELGGSVLTSCLLEGVVKGEAANDDDEVTLSALASYVKAQAPRYGAQQPQYWAIAAGGEVIFARRPTSYDDVWREQANQLVMRHHLEGHIERELERELRLAIDAPVEPGNLAAKELIDQLFRKKISLTRFAVRWAELQEAPETVEPPLEPPGADPRVVERPVFEPPDSKLPIDERQTVGREPDPNGESGKVEPEPGTTVEEPAPPPNPVTRTDRYVWLSRVMGAVALFTLAMLPLDRVNRADMVELAFLFGAFAYSLLGFVLLAMIARSKTYADSADERRTAHRLLFGVNGPPLVALLWFMGLEHAPAAILIFNLILAVPSLLIFMVLQGRARRKPSAQGLA